MAHKDVMSCKGTEMAAYDLNQGFEEKKGKQETAASYEAFTTYLELGRERTLRKVAQVVGTSEHNIQNMSKRFNWVARAAYYDADQVRGRFKEVREQREKEHRAAILQFRKDQERRALAMGELADLMLEITTDKIQSMRAAGEHISENSLSNIARTVSSLAEMSANLQATALGIDELEAALDQELGA